MCGQIYGIHKTYHYDTSLLYFEKDTCGSNVFEKIRWHSECRDAPEGGIVGNPELPIFHHTTRIMDNMDVDSVKVTLLQGISGILENPIMPIQPPVPISEKTMSPPFVMNNNTYQTNIFLPSNHLVDYSIDLARDGRFLTIAIIPFQYNPLTSEYTAYSVADVEIFTHELKCQPIQEKNRTGIGIPYYEYVIITSSSLQSAFEPFAQWKRAKGYDVGIVSINEILSNPNLANGDEVSHIVDDAGKLRQYLIESYNTAQTKYVLLGGDSTIIPIRYCYSKNINIPCDFYYSELNSNWDTNNNGLYGERSDYVDYGAEIYVGRLLCNSNDEVKNWTKKLL